MLGLKEFITENHGAEAWSTILSEAGLGQRIYVPVTEYPDEHVFTIVEAAAELTGDDPATIQYEF